MLNDFHMMVLAIVATQGSIAALLVFMARLEPEKTIAGSSRPSARRPVTAHPAPASRNPARPTRSAVPAGHES